MDSLPWTFLPSAKVFIVGNTQYPGKLHLPNASKDADNLKDRLSDIGLEGKYDVTFLKNAWKSTFWKEFHEFCDKISSDSACIFYFAGHALEIDGVNYLLPINSELQTLVDHPKPETKRKMIEDVCISFQKIQTEILGRNPKLLVMILDACRENPIMHMASSGSGRANTREIYTPTSRDDVILIFSTSPTELSSDGDGSTGGGPFANSLIKWITQPLSIQNIMMQVATEVKCEVGQIPWFHSASSKNFVLPCTVSDETVDFLTTKARLSEVVAKRFAPILVAQRIMVNGEVNMINRNYLEELLTEKNTPKLEKEDFEKLYSSFLECVSNMFLSHHHKKPLMGSPSVNSPSHPPQQFPNNYISPMRPAGDSPPINSAPIAIPTTISAPIPTFPPTPNSSANNKNIFAEILKNQKSDQQRYRSLSPPLRPFMPVDDPSPPKSPPLISTHIQLEKQIPAQASTTTISIIDEHFGVDGIGGSGGGPSEPHAQIIDLGDVKDPQEFLSYPQKIFSGALCHPSCRKYFCRNCHPPERRFCARPLLCTNWDCPFIHHPDRKLAIPKHNAKNCKFPHDASCEFCQFEILLLKYFPYGEDAMPRDEIERYPLVRELVKQKVAPIARAQHASSLQTVGLRHKPCDFGVLCTKFGCNFLHPPGRNQDCGHGISCIKYECSFLHPQERNRMLCRRVGCSRETGCRGIHPMRR